MSYTVQSGVKRSVTRIIFLVFIGLMACAKTSVQWIYYDETNCADKWTSSGTNEILKDNITEYCKSAGVKILEIEIITDRNPDNCSECICKTGRRVHCKISKSDIDKSKGLGFYE
jgi:hypothetical protein